jgi:hypothetical protein
MGSVPSPLRGIKPLSEETAATGDSEQRVLLYPGSLIVVRIEGSIHAGPDLVRLTSKLSGHIREASGAVSVFFDLAGFVRYESEVRVRYTEAIRQHGDKVDRILVYADGRLVKMGAQVAGLVLPQLRIVSRTEFDQALATSGRRSPN